MQIEEHEFFKNNNYLRLNNFLSNDLCQIFNYYARFQAEYDHTPEIGADAQIPNSHARYADFFTESLLLALKPRIEQAIGEKLLPTYSYYRVYKRGDQLTPHLDRAACEISMTICTDVNKWPFYIINAYKPDDKAIKTVNLEQGDALIYKGTQVVHWREQLAADQHTQVFLHYVRENGEYAEHVHDGRKYIGQPKISNTYEYVKYSKFMNAVLEYIK